MRIHTKFSNTFKTTQTQTVAEDSVMCKFLTMSTAKESDYIGQKRIQKKNAKSENIFFSSFRFAHLVAMLRPNSKSKVLFNF